jgi:creatinine amidohydrolase
MKRVLFLNGHAGNVPYLNELARELERAHGVRCAQIDWWRFIQPLVEDLVEAEILPHGHASEFGTSVMLHLVPQAVKMERATRTPPKIQNRFPDFLRPAAYRQMTDNGLLGDGTKGTAAKGAETLRRAADRIAEFVQGGEFRAG